MASISKENAMQIPTKWCQKKKFDNKSKLEPDIANQFGTAS